MSPQQIAVFAVLCGTLVLNGWVAAGLVGLGSRGTENDGARIAVDPPQATAIAENSADRVSILGIIDAAFSDLDQIPPPVRIALASTPDPVQKEIETSAPPFEVSEMASILAALPDPQEMLAPVRVASVSAPDSAQRDIEASAPPGEPAEIGHVGIALPDPREMLPQAKPPVRLVSLFRSAPSDEDLKPAVRVVETPNECLVVEICIDDYLWSFYERTPKVDTNKVQERVTATIKRKGKTRTVIKTITKYVAADFTWKDPIAAQKAGMSVKDYVIG